MKALVLNSGLGSRMAYYTKDRPKCMAELVNHETIIKRQLRLLREAGVVEVVITTGPYKELLKKYVEEVANGLKVSFVHNSLYESTNYIYSIYLAKDLLQDDLLLLHGDLIFTKEVLDLVLHEKRSCITVDYSAQLPEKDFKVVLAEGRVKAIGIEFFDNAVAAQPMYYLEKEVWEKWLKEIIYFCQRKEIKCYAENALNQILDKIELFPIDVQNYLCQEVDNMDDLLCIRNILKRLE